MIGHQASNSATRSTCTFDLAHERRALIRASAGHSVQAVPSLLTFPEHLGLCRALDRLNRR
jgi:hypothetical protein